MTTTPPAPLVASEVDPLEVEASIRAEIASKPSPRSQETYAKDWNKYTTWLATQNVPIWAVRPKHITRYRDFIHERYSPKSVSRMLTVVRMVYGRIACDEFMLANPAREVRAPRSKRETNAPHISDPEEIKRLLNAFDPEGDFIERRDHLVMGVLLLMGHGRKSGPDSMPAYCRPKVAKAISGCTVWYIVDRACKRAGIKHYGVHSMRRTTFTYLSKEGVPIGDIQGMAGHESSQTTQIYIKERHVLAVGNKYEELLGDCGKTPQVQSI